MPTSVTTHLVQVRLTLFPTGYVQSLLEWIKLDCIDGLPVEDSLSESPVDTDNTRGFIEFFFRAEKPIMAVEFFFISEGLPMSNPLLYYYTTMRMDAFGDRNLAHLKALAQQSFAETIAAETELNLDPENDVIQTTFLTVWKMSHSSPPEREDYDSKVELLGWVPLDFSVYYRDQFGSSGRIPIA